MVVKTCPGNQNREEETCPLIRTEGSRDDCKDMSSKAGHRNLTCYAGQRDLETAVKTYPTKRNKEILGHARDATQPDLVSNYRKLQNSGRDSRERDILPSPKQTDSNHNILKEPSVLT